MSHITYLKEVIVMKEGRVVLKFALLSFIYFILPLLLQFSYTLKQTQTWDNVLLLNSITQYVYDEPYICGYL